MFWDQSDGSEIFYQWNYSGIILFLHLMPCSCNFYMGAETDVATSTVKQTCCAWIRLVSHLLGKSTQWQLEVRLKVLSRERNWESLRRKGYWVVPGREQEWAQVQVEQRREEGRKRVGWVLLHEQYFICCFLLVLYTSLARLLLVPGFLNSDNC